jgi:hypothetical protein
MNWKEKLELYARRLLKKDYFLSKKLRGNGRIYTDKASLRTELLVDFISNMNGTPVILDVQKKKKR